VFPLFGAFYYWFPKFTGRLMGEKLGQWSFWLMFVGFNVAFFPMHLLGLHGMPRRVWTYQAGMGWDGLNLTATIGAYTLALGILLSLINAIRSAKAGVTAGPNPWGAGSLEWATDSPPPTCNFYTVPIVYGRDPVWQPAPADAPVAVSGLAADAREQLITTVIDALPDHRIVAPSPTPWPFISAVATTILFIGSIFTPWAIVWGSVIVAVPLIFWFWPKRGETAIDLALEKRP
jgi:cytochrome c oxidase subunit 1